MKNYAYLAKDKQLHITKNEATAKEHGKYIETDIPYYDNGKGNVRPAGGDPVVQDGYLNVYSLDEVYLNGNRASGKRVSLENYPGIKALYEKLM